MAMKKSSTTTTLPTMATFTAERFTSQPECCGGGAALVSDVSHRLAINGLINGDSGRKHGVRRCFVMGWFGTTCMTATNIY